MFTKEHIKQSFNAAFPIMLGYVAIGIPCGLLSDSIGLNALQVFLLSLIFYSGAGQFMIPNMFLSGASLASTIASVSFVNTRQMLYSARFAPECKGVSKRISFLFAATVTDESFGVSIAKFEEGDWSVDRALMVNLFSQSSWVISTVVGTLIGSALNIPLHIASFAMTAIFICLMVTQKLTSGNIIAMICAMVGVYACKALGLTGPAILIGAVFGVCIAMAVSKLQGKWGSGGGSAAEGSLGSSGDVGGTEGVNSTTASGANTDGDYSGRGDAG